jgi:cytochrome c biogenesis protein CcmG/thiol:disulfide interchange protein DsbE
MNRYLIPLGVFAVLVVFLGIGLGLNPREIPSPLIGKPAPAFELVRLQEPDKVFARKDMLGKVWLLNVWASWCVSCREEHPVLLELAKSDVVPVYGLNYKDQRNDALAWLKQFGDPYQLSIIDGDGRVGIDYGVYGVPETFVIDKAGMIRYKQIGPVTPQALKDKILPLVRQLQQSLNGSSHCCCACRLPLLRKLRNRRRPTRWRTSGR